MSSSSSRGSPRLQPALNTLMKVGCSVNSVHIRSTPICWCWYDHRRYVRRHVLQNNEQAGATVLDDLTQTEASTAIGTWASSSGHHTDTPPPVDYRHHQRLGSTTTCQFEFGDATKSRASPASIGVVRRHHPSAWFLMISHGFTLPGAPPSDEGSLKSALV